MRIVITGAFGRLGSAVAARAVARGDQVVAVDRVVPATTPDGIEAVLADVGDYARMREIIDGADGVVHLAAHLGPHVAPWERVYAENTVGSYHVLLAAAEGGVSRVCLASSINAIGGVYSRQPRFDYFPVDVDHPCYAEDPYGLSKWAMEDQARSIVRRFPHLTTAALRLHGLSDRDPHVRVSVDDAQAVSDPAAFARNLWGHGPLGPSADACLAALEADLTGAEVFYCVGSSTVAQEPTADLVRRFYPTVPLRAPLPDHAALYDSGPARDRLGWTG